MIVRGTEAGVSWSELAQGDPLAAVLDSADTAGVKNRAIDRVHKHALRRAAPNVQGKAVLDFGCGTGRLSEWLAQDGARVTGVDVTPEMVEVARKRVPNVRFHTIDGSRVPFPDGSFDLILTVGVLLYYVRDDRSVIRELVRVLRAGGQLIAIEQVTEDEMGRGGDIQAYKQMFSDAGMRLLGARAIRVSDSRVVALVQRHPSLSRLSVLPRLVQWEAHTAARYLPLRRGRYADFTFVTEKEL